MTLRTSLSSSQYLRNKLTETSRYDCADTVDRMTQKSLPFLMILVFAMALVLFVNQVWSVEISGVPIQVFLVWIVAVWLFLFRGQAFVCSLFIFSPWQKVAIATLIGFAFLRGMLDGGNILRTAQIMTGIAIALEAAVIFHDARGRNMIFIAQAFAAVASSVVAVLQWLNLSPELWQKSVYSYAGYYTYGATGLEATPVPYAYSVVGIGVILMAGWMLAGKRLKQWLSFSPILAFLFSGIVVVGLIASRSRSGLLGLIIGTGIIVIGARSLRLKSLPLPIWIAIGGAALGYVLTVRESPLFEDLRLMETWITYVPILFAFPLGRPDFLAWDDLIYEAYSDSIYLPASVQSFMGQVIAPHNLFLTTGMAYGPLAMVALFILYASMLFNGLKVFRRMAHDGDIQLAVWVLVLIAANVAVLIHSWFHNASIAVGEMRSWLWVGLLLSQARIATERAHASKPDHTIVQKTLQTLK